MGQSEILKLLKSKGKWMSAKEMSKKLGTNDSNIRKQLNNLMSQGLVIKRDANKKKQINCALWRIR